MKGTTHLASGLVLAALAPNQTLAITAGLAIGSVLPDIDSSTSLLGRYIPIIPMLLKHRGVTHGAIIPLAMLMWQPTRALAAGMLVHLLLDMFNPEGVPLLWPYQKRFRVPVINSLMRSGGMVDKLLGCVLWALAIYLYMQLALGNPVA